MKKYIVSQVQNEFSSKGDLLHSEGESLAEFPSLEEAKVFYATVDLPELSGANEPVTKEIVEIDETV